MITRALLPFPSSRLADGAQIFIPWQGRGFGIAMLPDAGIFARRNMDACCWGPDLHSLIHFALVLGPIGCQAEHGLLNFGQGRLDQVWVMDPSSTQESGLNFSAGAIYQQMQLTPGAAF